MRKLLYLLLALPFALLGTACSDDNSLPDVNVTLTFDNAVAQDGVIYAVKTETLSLSSIVTKSVDNDKPATIANVKYYWNYIPAPQFTWSNMPIEMNLAELPLVESGYNVLSMDAAVLQVDKSLAYCSISVPIKAVDSAADLPDGQEPGTATITVRVGASKK